MPLSFAAAPSPSSPTTARSRRRGAVARTLTVVLACAALASALTLSARPALAQPRPSGGTAPAAPGGSEEITLAVGEQYVLPATEIRSYSEGAPGIVDIRVPQDGTRLLIVGQRAGTTSLLVIRNNGNQQTYAITVFRMPVDVVRRQVAQLVQGYYGVSVNQVGGRLFLEGGVANEQQQRRLQAIAALYPGQVESLVTVDATIVERRINVRLDLYFVDLSRTSGFAFGLNWPSFIGAGPGSTAQLTGTLNGVASMGMPVGISQATASAIINQPLPRLDLAGNYGWVRIYRQATLVTVNGNEATYHSGGEYNVQVPGVVAGSVQRIEYGTTLTVAPRFDPATNRVDVRVQADLSDLADTGAAIPGRVISRVNTAVTLQLGQSIILSGLRAQSTTAGISGLPWLSQIPVLGILFGSHSRRDRDNENVVFIIPSVIEGMSTQSAQRVNAALRAYEEYGDGQRRTVTLVPPPAPPPPVQPPAAAPLVPDEPSAEPRGGRGGRR